MTLMMDNQTSTPQVPQVGAHQNVPFPAYAAMKCVNWHTLLPFAISALEGRKQLTTPDESSEDQELGTAFHTSILEPEKFAEQYVVMPNFPGNHNSNAYKSAVAQWKEDNKWKAHLTENEMYRLKMMRAACMAHPTVSAILNAKGKNELSIVWKDAPTGELCKGRIDRIARIPAKALNPTSDGDVIVMVDFKKTSKFHSFNNEIARYRYHGQMAFYRDGLAAISPGNILPLIIAVEDDEPFDVAIYNPGIGEEQAHALWHGEKLYRRCMSTMLAARKSGNWPGICPYGTIPVVLPKYAEEGTVDL